MNTMMKVILQCFSTMINRRNYCLPIFLLGFSFVILACKSKDCVTLKEEDYQRNAAAEQQCDNQEFGKAMSMSTAAILVNPENYIAHSNRGIFLYYQCSNTGKITPAQKDSIYADFQKSISICPDFSKGYRNLIRTAFKLNDYDLVIESGHLYNSRFEKTAELMSFLADSYFKKGQYESALKFADEAVNVDSRLGSGYIIRGKSHTKLGQFEAAVKDLTTAIDLDHNDWMAWHERGNCYLAQKQFQAARSDLITAMGIDTSRPEPLFSLGTLAIEMNNLSEACDYYHKSWLKLNESPSLVKNERLEKYLQRVVLEYCIKGEPGVLQQLHLLGPRI